MEMAEEGQIQPTIPVKRINSPEIVENEEEDQISALPDYLLVEILSRLDCTEDAIKTGTLSKRWKHLWTSLPHFFFNHDKDKLTWSDFVSFVDKTLTQCRRLKLKKFQVHTIRYDTRSVTQVNNWIRYAIKCNVEELDLTLLNTESLNEHLLDQHFFSGSCFTDLILTRCRFNPIGAICWKNLRSLCITDGKLDEDLIGNILSGSPVLETLILNDCYGYSRLNITSKSVKNLVLCGFYDPDNEIDKSIIEINAPSILSVTLKDDLYLWKLLLGNVSSLVEASLDYEKLGYGEIPYKKAEEEMLKGFVMSLRHVKELKIGIMCFEVLSRLEDKGFVFPSNLKVELSNCLEFVPL